MMQKSDEHRDGGQHAYVFDFTGKLPWKVRRNMDKQTFSDKKRAEACNQAKKPEK
jgi:hypothetical protein